MSFKQKSPLVIREGGTNTQSFTHAFGVAYYDGGALNNIDPGTATYVLTSNGASAPSFQAAAAGGIITIDGSSGSMTGATVTINGGTTGITTVASGSSMSLGGTLVVANGGTGVTSVTIAPTATAFAGWDANKNLSANSFISGFTTTATASGTTTLTVASTFHQFFTGTLSQTVVMPVTSTLVLGQQYQINNNSSAAITVTSSGSNNIQIMAPGSQIEITCILTSGTTAASWDAVYSPGFSLYPTAGALVTNSSGVISDATGTSGYILTSNGASTAPSFQAAAASSISITGDTGGALTGSAFTFSGGTTGLSFGGAGSTETLSGTVVLANGGTSASLTASNGGIFYSTASAGAILSGTATPRQMLQSGTSAAPAWSTTTWPATTTASQLLYSSSTSVVGEVTSGNYGVLISSSSGVPSWLANGTTGQVLTATTSGTPSWGAASSGGFTWNNVTGATQAMAINNGYISNDGATLVTMTLPSTAAVGSVVSIQGAGTGLWTLAQNASQQIFANGGATTAGTGGSISSSGQYDSISVVCITANTGWAMNTSSGNLNFV